MKINETIKKECMKICEEYEIEIDFNNENWENEFINRIDWCKISIDYKLSKKIIEYFQNYVNWKYISRYQKLSENFIDKFQDKVDWFYISCWQILSENFIEKFQDKVNWHNIYIYQILSEEFFDRHKNKFAKYFWNLKSNKNKQRIIKNTKYKILNDDGGDYIVAYKSIRKNNKSFHDPENYEYAVGEIYESTCDCSILNENSHGLAAWDKENAIEFGKDVSETRYYPEGFKLIKVKIYINDIGVIIKNNNNKIRCSKFQVVEDLGVYEMGYNGWEMI